MEEIKWEDDEVCYANGVIWKTSPHSSTGLFWETNTGHYLKCRQMSCEDVLEYNDFQLNEIQLGDYIEASELDTEQKYDDAVAVFELFGINHLYSFGEISELITNLTVDDDCKLHPKNTNNKDCVRKLTYPQLMAIGKLKRAMIERDGEIVCGKPKEDFIKAIDKVKELASESPLDTSGFNTIEESRNKRNKSKQAYAILESLDYNYDTDKQQWYQKVYV